MTTAEDHRSSHQYFFFTYSGSFTSTRSSLSFTRFLAADKSERACRCAHVLLNRHRKHLQITADRRPFFTVVLLHHILHISTAMTPPAVEYFFLFHTHAIQSIAIRT